MGGTRGHKGLQGVTISYKVFTWGYKGLQRVTGGDKGLHGVTMRYKGDRG